MRLIKKFSWQTEVLFRDHLTFCPPICDTDLKIHKGFYMPSCVYEFSLRVFNSIRVSAAKGWDIELNSRKIKFISSNGNLKTWKHVIFSCELCMLFAGREVRIGKKTVLEVLSTYSRPRAQFFPTRTDLGRQITCLLFSSVEYFVSSFCVEFSLQPFSNQVNACVWHLGNRKSNQHYTHWRKLRNDFIYLFTFYVLCSEKKTAGKDANAGKLVAVRTRGPDRKIRTAGARAISQSYSRI